MIRQKASEANIFDSICSRYMSDGGEGVVDIITFCEAPWGMNIKLYPVQKFTLKLYYGIELDDVEKTIKVPNDVNDRTLHVFTEAAFLQWLIDEKRTNLKEFPESGSEFRELVLVGGRRGGKTLISSVVENYEIYKLVKVDNPQKFFGFPEGQEICITNVATSDEQAGILFELTKSGFMACSILRDRGVNFTKTYFNVQSDRDVSLYGQKQRATVNILSGGCSAKNLRGRNNIVILFDELAFFLDNSGRFSGDEVYKALAPSTMSFGQRGKIISISSPYARYGKFWQLYQQSFEHPDTMLMLKLYSSILNPTLFSGFLKTEKKKDPISFLTEYGAEFSDKVVAWIDDEDRFMQAVDTNRVNNAGRGRQHEKYFYGIDLGFKNDGTAMAIVHKEGPKIILDWAQVWFSGSSDVWNMSDSIYHRCDKYQHREILEIGDLVTEIEALLPWFPCSGGWFDQRDGYALMEILRSRDLNQFRMVNTSSAINSEVYQLGKTLLNEGLLRLFNHKILIPEILSLEGERVGGGKIVVRKANKTGSHDDISDALFRAVYDCFNYHKEEFPHVTLSTNNPVSLIRKNDNGDVQKVAKSMNIHRVQKRKAHGEHPRQAISGRGVAGNLGVKRRFR